MEELLILAVAAAGFVYWRAKQRAKSIARMHARTLGLRTGLPASDIYHEMVIQRLTPGEWARRHGLHPLTFDPLVAVGQGAGSEPGGDKSAPGRLVASGGAQEASFLSATQPERVTEPERSHSERKHLPSSRDVARLPPRRIELVRVGDDVITRGGIHGTVHAVSQDHMDLVVDAEGETLLRHHSDAVFPIDTANLAVLPDDLAHGDDVISVGGLHGRVAELRERTADLMVDEDGDLLLRHHRRALRRLQDAVTSEATPKPSLSIGDDVVTRSGLLGCIVEFEEDAVDIAAYPDGDVVLRFQVRDVTAQDSIGGGPELGETAR